MNNAMRRRDSKDTKLLKVTIAKLATSFFVAHFHL